MEKPINSAMPLEAYLVPVVAKRKPLPRGKHAEISARIAARAVMSAKRKLSAVSSKPTKSQSTASTHAGHEQAFDRKGYAAFLSRWSEELDTLPSTDRERLEARVKPFFMGATMDKEWRDIIYALRGIRNAIARAAPSPRQSFAHGGPAPRGW